MNLQESGEMYLETIYVLSQTYNEVHSINVCEAMGFSKPSVSRAVSILKANGYLIMEHNGALILTESGLSVAQKIYERHTVLSTFLMKLGVDEETAVNDACKMEHDISDQTLNAIKQFIEGNIK